MRSPRDLPHRLVPFGLCMQEKTFLMRRFSTHTSQKSNRARKKQSTGGGPDYARHRIARRPGPVGQETAYHGPHCAGQEDRYVFPENIWWWVR